MLKTPNSYKTTKDVEDFLKPAGSSATITKKTVTTGDEGLASITVEGKKALWFVESGYKKPADVAKAPDSIVI